MGFHGGWPRYVPVAERRDRARRKVAALKKKGYICHPVVVEGRTLARTFWGQQWCRHLETYSDYASRLPRGRTYVRNGSVVDLQINAGRVTALVAGSEVYEVTITLQKLADARWQRIQADCAGQITSLVELLQGRLSQAVMSIVARPDQGLFPSPDDIHFQCNCLDGASLCKHVAATLYGTGVRFDNQPELLFLLRRVDPQALIQQAGSLPVAELPAGQFQPLDATDLSGLFGIALDTSPVSTEVQVVISKKQEHPPLVSPPEPAGLPDTVTARELMARGIPRHVHGYWLKTGILLRTAGRGVYQTTPQTQWRLMGYLRDRKVTVP